MAYRLGEGLRSGTFATLIPLLDADTDAAWTLFGQRADQRLSFTDCTSYVLMRRLRLPAMITLDADFKALGLQTLP